MLKIFANETGYIQSPDLNKDGIYEKNLDCVWTISAADNEVIRLTFESFSLEEIDNPTNRCRDFVQINDGFSSDEPLIDVYCGKRKPDQIQSSSSKLFVYFKTDELIESTGFKIKYEVIKSTCGDQINLLNEGDYVSKANSSFVYSPNYPQSYPNNIRCKWTWTIPFYIRLELTVIDFNLNCTNNDYLQFSSDDKHDSLIKLCTQSDYLNNRRFVASSGLWLIFNSGQANFGNNLVLGNAPNSERNSGNQQFRFKIGWKILNCNQSYTADNGLIVSSKYPAIWSSQSNEICKFTIETDVGRTISVYFTDFSIGKIQAASSCNENRMEIKDGKQGM